MPEVTAASPILGPMVALAIVSAGVWFVWALDEGLARRAAGRAVGVDVLLAPGRHATALLRRRRRRTAAEDRPAALLAPALLFTVAFTGFAVIPLSPTAVGADVATGVLFFFAALAPVMVAVFLAGWSPDSPYALHGAYRFAGQAVAYSIPIAVVVVSVALPAGSLRLTDVVASQADLWNVVFQSIGLAVYAIGALALAFWGPLGAPVGADLAGGAEAELSGPQLLLWRVGRYALLLLVAAFAVPTFLGGWLGPGLTPEVWVVLKTLAVATVFVALRHRLAQWRPETFMAFAWKILIPVALANVFYVGAYLLATGRTS